jgi:cysteine-rich repeat protein
VSARGVRSSLTGCLVAALLAQSCLDWGSLEQGRCGDGFVGREEACDDGNRVSGDGCDDSCRIEPPYCGDGRVDEGEDCDDANALDDDACREGCVAARCGDGTVWELEEQCDDGNSTSGDGCSTACVLEPVSAGPRCGDGVLDAGEACDDGNDADGDGCLAGCSWATCGDGRVRLGVEECDPGVPGSGCTRGCMVCPGAPGSYFRAGNGHCYTLHAEPTSETQARARCHEEGGYLWTATSQSEAADVPDKLGLQGRIWLGLLTTVNGRSWITGENDKFTNFAPGEPRDAALRCVAVDAASGSWFSQDCATALGFVCERSPALVEPLDHHAYRLHTAPMSADAARLGCADEGGRLVALESEAERLFLGKQVGLAVWVDARDDSVAGQFVWPSGAVVDRAAFAAGQPDDVTDSQQCLLLNAGAKLADAVCGEPHAWVCEFD